MSKLLTFGVSIQCWISNLLDSCGHLWIPIIIINLHFRIRSTCLEVTTIVPLTTTYRCLTFRHRDGAYSPQECMPADIIMSPPLFPKSGSGLEARADTSWHLHDWIMIAHVNNWFVWFLKLAWFSVGNKFN